MTIDINKLSDNERKEYNDVQVNYREGRGFSEDAERFEKYLYYINRLASAGSDSSILDVGCGPGPLERYLHKYGYTEVDAIDFSSEGIKICKENVPEYNYKVGNINDIKNIYSGRKFDITFCCQVLEHIPHHEDIFKQLYNLTKAGGMMIVSVPWDKCKNSDRHINHYLPSTFHKLCEKLGVSENTIITERFGDCSLQLLFILLKEKDHEI